MLHEHIDILCIIKLSPTSFSFHWWFSQSTVPINVDSFLFYSIGYNPLLSLFIWYRNVPYLASERPFMQAPLSLWQVLIPWVLSYSLVQDTSGSSWTSLSHPIPCHPFLYRGDLGWFNALKSILELKKKKGSKETKCYLPLYLLF